jgi:hypothetical protein
MRRRVEMNPLPWILEENIFLLTVTPECRPGSLYPGDPSVTWMQIARDMNRVAEALGINRRQYVADQVLSSHPV